MSNKIVGKRMSSRGLARALSLAATPCALAAAFAVLVTPTPSHSAALACTPEAAQAVAPPGMTVGPIDDLNPSLPPVPTGALLVPATDGVPTYCLLTGTFVTNPSTGKVANFGMALPLIWNNKFLQVGCGGLCGEVFQTLPASPASGGRPTDALARGYAIAATDDGHAATPRGVVFDGSWAITAPGVSDTEAVTDFYYRAVHMLALVGKDFVQRWYAGTLARSYFAGCSDGGREGMVEATRYPDDFDGTIAGNPFFDIRGETLAGGRAARALLAAPDSYIPPALLQIVDNAVRASCDAADGVQDGLIQNPGKCSFNPESLLCRDGNTQNCLSQNQVGTLLRWFAATRDRKGRVASPGYPVSDIYNAAAPGLNLSVWAEAAGAPLDINAAEPWGTSPPPAWQFYDNMLKYLVYLDPNFDSNHHSPADFLNTANDRALALIDARTQPGSGDFPQLLGPFLGSGRKLILCHGYSDGWISPFRTVRFYQDWARLVGGYGALKRTARLFMVPGMYHCGGGPGPNTFDALTALERWVENNLAPEEITAVKYKNDDPTQPALRTMPLCGFPTQARLTAYGDVNNASNWSCAANQDLLQIGLDGALAGLGGPER